MVGQEFSAHASVHSSTLGRLGRDELDLLLHLCPTLALTCKVSSAAQWWPLVQKRKEWTFREVHRVVRRTRLLRAAATLVSPFRMAFTVPMFRHPRIHPRIPVETIECVTDDVEGFMFAFLQEHTLFCHLANKVPVSLPLPISVPPLGANPPGKVWNGRDGGWVPARVPGPYLYYIPTRGYLDLSLVDARNALTADVGAFRCRTHSEMDATLREGRVSLHHTLLLPPTYFLCWQVISL